MEKAMSGKNWHQCLAETVDSMIFIKNGYSFFRHLVPFAIASLLLLILAGDKTSQDDLLFKLLMKFRSPTILWLPSIILTLISLSIYLIYIKKEIEDAYLIIKHIWLRSIFTAVFYLLLCTGIAVAVICKVSNTEVDFATVWASLIISALAMTGIDWKFPKEVVNAVGIIVPNYKKTNSYISGIKGVLANLKKNKRGTKEDVTKLKEYFQNLAICIDENGELEPDWARGELKQISLELISLVQNLQNKFMVDDDAATDLYVVWRYSKEYQYKDFICSLKEIHKHWPDWKLT